MTSSAPDKPETPESPKSEKPSILETNEAFYGELRPGVQDYWRKMAAPRFRVATVLRELEKERPRTIVDLGCGNGALCEEIHARLPDAEVAGVDLSPAQIAANTRRLSWGQWLVADLGTASPPALGRTFDAVVTSEVIEHVSDPAAFLRNARSLARRGSMLVLSTQSGKVQETEKRVGHLQHFSVEAMTRLLTETGWRPERVWNAGYPFHDLSKWWANRDPDASMASFADKPYGPKEDAICAALRFAFRLNSSRRGAQLFAVARCLG
ncbi:MAG: class I SAM-dependent methyltransferase [Sandaracinaceae bacterium]|nr:class I SAM-dependent methyltransferase [Sandaracinaceae bacterium]